MLCRRKAQKYYNLREEEPVAVTDSDRRLSYKVVTKEKDKIKTLIK